MVGWSSSAAGRSVIGGFVAGGSMIEYVPVMGM